MDYQKLFYELLDTKREDDYWDFKEEWYNNNAAMLHDIICFANNRVDRDSYIILGVRDKNFKIIGIENDKNRKTQQNIIDFLKGVSFVSNIRPSIELRTINIEKHEIDILTIKNSYDTPFYITNDYRDKEKLVRANYVYTRIKDTNTPINSNADVNQIEYLWRKRFRLTATPIKQFFYMIKTKEDWEERYDSINNMIIYHNQNKPEYTIKIKLDEEEGAQQFYCFVQCDKRVYFGELTFNYFETEIFSHQVISLDGSRFLTIRFEDSFLHLDGNKDYDFGYKYLIRDSDIYTLFKFLYNCDDSDQRFAFQNHKQTYLEFNTEKEKENFERYLFDNKNEVINRVRNRKIEISDNIYFEKDYDNLYKEVVIQKLAVADVFNKYLELLRH